MKSDAIIGHHYCCTMTTSDSNVCFFRVSSRFSDAKLFTNGPPTSTYDRELRMRKTTHEMNDRRKSNETPSRGRMRLQPFAVRDSFDPMRACRRILLSAGHVPLAPTVEDGEGCLPRASSAAATCVHDLVRVASVIKVVSSLLHFKCVPYRKRHFQKVYF